MASPESKSLISNSLTLSFDYKAVAAWAQGTGALIATALAIPDTIATIPVTKSVISLFLNFVGLWISALVLWYVGSQAMLHVLAFLFGPIKVDDAGIKFWRFGKPMKWETIAAAAVEPQPLFGRICFLRKIPLRFTFFEVQKGKVHGRDVPSFFYDEKTFDTLTRLICKRVFNLVPNANNVVLAQSIADKEVKETYKARRWQRVLIAVLIACGTVFFLYRKASVNYAYNNGNHYFKLGNYNQAEENYQKALKTSPAFAAAWQALAAVEFHKGEYADAEKHWQTALVLKPDFVEAKVGMANVLMKKGQFENARNYLERALKLAPRNPSALLHLSELELKQGNKSESLRIARFVLSIDPNNKVAKTLIEKAKEQIHENHSTSLRISKPFLPSK